MSAPERRHETTVDGETAWSGGWIADSTVPSCAVYTVYARVALVTVHRQCSTMTLECDEELVLAEALVLAKVLLEAAELAQRGEVQS